MCSYSVLSFFSKWRLWIRPLLIALYVILIIVLVPILIAHSISNGFSSLDQGSLVGGGFVLLALPISIWQIIQHVVHYTKPSLQKHIIRWVINVNKPTQNIFTEFSIQRSLINFIIFSSPCCRKKWIKNCLIIMIKWVMLWQF